MTAYMLMAATIIIACVIFNKISGRLGIPMLLAFILLGMFFGSDGVVKIPFEDYAFAEQICSVALVFIMFYGGFGTKLSAAKPIAVQAVLLSSFGTVITSSLVGLFCHFILKMDILESFLLGSVISSTDAASVFSILRSNRLNLKYNTASMLEVESGSNDPFAYMLTVTVLSLMTGRTSGSEFLLMLVKQIAFGVVLGLITAGLALLFLKKVKISAQGFDAIFIVGVALISYAVPTAFGGNGYLGAYITGIILGNSRIANKQALVNFFDGATGLMQMLLFFLLGLLSFPSKLLSVAVTAIPTALFLTFIARPAAVFMILSPFKSKIRQQLVVSWAGMRGAASIVFAIMAVTSAGNDIFHTVFFIVMFSILLQGTLLPFVAKKLDMTDEGSDVMKTFTDYTEEVPVQFLQFTVSESHPWAGKAVSTVELPPESLLVLVIRDGKNIVPDGQTEICSGDTLILSGKASEKIDGINLYEKAITRDSGWAGKSISELPPGENLIILIRRGDGVIIPKGNVVLEENDVLVINERQPITV